MLRLVILLWIGLHGAGWAQVVTVRSGDHPGFARLVLTFPEPVGWDFGRTADGYGFRARAGRLRYDISTVFQLIGRDRLSAIWVDPETGVLRFGLGCACHAIATPFRPGIVVIDILDGPAPPESPYELALAEPGQSVPPLSVRQLRPRPRPAGLVVDAATGQTGPLPATDPDHALPVVLPLLPSPRALALRDHLLTELAASVAAGAIQPVTRLAAPRSDATTAAPEAAADQTPSREVPVQMVVQEPGGLPRRFLTRQGLVCIAAEDLDLAAWGSDEPVPLQIAAARAGLVGEFDSPDKARILGLARLYLRIGFGAEALAHLAELTEPDPAVEVLRSLARIVDGGRDAGIFVGMEGCDGPAAFWAVAALPPSSAAFLAGLNRSAVLQAFSALPPGLRRQLGPELAEWFLTSGDMTTARALREAIDRASADADPAVAIIDARLEMKADPARAEQGLRSVAEQDRTLAPAALAALSDSLVRRGAVPDEDLVLALGLALREAGGPELDIALAAAHARALVVSGQSATAFADLSAYPPAVQADLWALLADRAEAADVAGLALGRSPETLRSLSSDTRIAVTRRLLDLGLPTAADPWLSGLTGAAPDLLRAEAALQNRNARAVLTALAGQDGAEADRLRARALEQLGDPAAAAEVWDRLGDAAQAARLRLRLRDWQVAGPQADPGIAALLAIAARSPQPEPLDPDAPLATGRRILADGTETRRTIAALLDAEIPR